MARKQKEQIHEYQVPMRLVFDTTVTVEAASQEEAQEKAEAYKWIDNGLAIAEMIDCDRMGIAKRTD